MECARECVECGRWEMASTHTTEKFWMLCGLVNEKLEELAVWKNQHPLFHSKKWKSGRLGHVREKDRRQCGYTVALTTAKAWDIHADTWKHTLHVDLDCAKPFSQEALALFGMLGLHMFASYWYILNFFYYLFELICKIWMYLHLFDKPLFRGHGISNFPSFKAQSSWV